MLAYFFPNSYVNYAKLTIIFKLTIGILYLGYFGYSRFRLFPFHQPFHKLPHLLKVLYKGLILFHDSAQKG